jgi:hypothetical protein
MTDDFVNLERVIADLHSAVLEIESVIAALEKQSVEREPRKDAARAGAAKACRKVSA